MDIKFDKITSDNTKTFNPFNMKWSDTTLNKTSSSYEQPSDDPIKFTRLKSTERSSHASQFTKHLSSTTLEGDTLLQIKKRWYAICSAFWQSLSTKNTCPPQNISQEKKSTILLYTPTGNTFQVNHSKINPSSILKSTMSSYCQIWNYPLL